MSYRIPRSVRLPIALVLALALVYLVAPAPPTEGTTPLEGVVLVVTDLAAGGSCDAGRICVEECWRTSTGTDLPTGRICCASSHQIGVVGIGCSQAGGIVDRYGAF